MKIKVKLKDLTKVMEKTLSRAVTKGASQSVNHGTQMGLYKISVIGTTAKSYVNANGSGSKTIIVGSILNGLGAWGLEKGVKDPLMQSAYPRLGNANGVFVSFRNEPHLREWAKQKVKFFDPTLTGITIGNPKTTMYGKKHWFTKTAMDETGKCLETNIRNQFKNK